MNQTNDHDELDNDYKFFVNYRIRLLEKDLTSQKNEKNDEAWISFNKNRRNSYVRNQLNEVKKRLIF